MTRPSVPDVAKLRSICQAGKLSKDSRSFYALSRRISIYITWLLLHTEVRPNQVTVVTVLLALVGVCLLAAGPSWVAIWGAICLLGHYFLDKVDGDLARFHQAHVELLPVVLMMVMTMGVQEVAATVGKNDDVVTVAGRPILVISSDRSVSTTRGSA